MSLPDFANTRDAKKLLRNISSRMTATDPVTIMEVCGTHTVEIGRSGLRHVLPENLTLISGPGCPVCVTPADFIDQAANAARDSGVTVLTYGDMIRVPGNETSLETVSTAGADVRVVTSAAQAVDLADQNPNREFMFLAVGFETTMPGTAVAVLQAHQKKLKNLSFFISHRVVPPALEALADDPELALSGFLLPGHVSAIIGTGPYAFLADQEIPGAVTGFETVDILLGVLRVVEMSVSHKAEIVNAYPRAVKDKGNPTAVEIIHRVFEPCDAVWRGIGSLPESGKCLRSEYADYDAAERYNLTIGETRMPDGCSCGDVLRGKIRPRDCPLFGKACVPEHPVGPCMVSSEGSCAAYFKFGMHRS